MDVKINILRQGIRKPERNKNGFLIYSDYDGRLELVIDPQRSVDIGTGISFPSNQSVFPFVSSLPSAVTSDIIITGQYFDEKTQELRIGLKNLSNNQARKIVEGQPVAILQFFNTVSVNLVE